MSYELLFIARVGIVMLIVQSFSTISAIHFQSRTCLFQNQVFLVSYSRVSKRSCPEVFLEISQNSQDICAPVVNYMRQNYNTATEKLAFKSDKSFSECNYKSSSTKFIYDKWNLFVDIPYCTIYYLRCAYCATNFYYWISYGINYSLV